MIADAVKAVLAALDDQGETDYADWDDQVATALASLEASYKVLRNPNRELIDYSELPVQAAYVYRYVVGHAEFVYQLLKRARAAAGQPLFDDADLWVTSLGGGPGTDLLGLMKYLSEDGNEPSVTSVVYSIIDKENNWSHVIDLFIENMNTVISVENHFFPCDITSEVIPDNVTLKDERLVIMSFFISEICCLPNKGRIIKNINKILESSPEGSVVLYNDSSAYSFFSFFNDRISGINKFSELISIGEELKAKCPNYEDIFEEYHNKFGYGFKLSGNIVARYMRRDEK